MGLPYDKRVERKSGILINLGTESFYCILQHAPGGGSPHNLGVLLYDGTRHRLLMRFREDYGFATELDAEVLSALGADLSKKATECDDPLEMIELLEDTLSNDILITERSIIEIDRDPTEVLRTVYSKTVEQR